MNISSVSSVQTKANFGWLLVFGVALLQTFSAVMLLLFSDTGKFETDTGVAWEELIVVFPTVADQISMSQQASLVATLALGLVSLSVTYFAMRNGQRWAWFTMWILPASIVSGMISLAQSENPAGVAVFAGVLALVAAAGLLISYPRRAPGS